MKGAYDKYGMRFILGGFEEAHCQNEKAKGEE
jgi:hypothetical protein